MIDWWTVGHFVWGVLLGWLGLRMAWIVGLAFGWEWLENVVLAPLGWGEPATPMGALNSVVDVGAAVAGAGLVVAFMAGGRWRERLDAWND